MWEAISSVSEAASWSQPNKHLGSTDNVKWGKLGPEKL